MSDISAQGHFHITSGTFDALVALVQNCIKVAQENDIGTTQYDWFVSSDKKEVIVRESYTDSDALIQHATNVAPYMAQLQAIASVSIQVFGEPSDALAEMLSSMNVPVFKPLASL